MWRHLRSAWRQVSGLAVWPKLWLSLPLAVIGQLPGQDTDAEPIPPAFLELRLFNLECSTRLPEALRLPQIPDLFQVAIKAAADNNYAAACGLFREIALLPSLQYSLVLRNNLACCYWLLKMEPTAQAQLSYALQLWREVRPSDWPTVDHRRIDRALQANARHFKL